MKPKQSSSNTLFALAAAGVAITAYFFWYTPNELAKADRRAARATATSARFATGPYVAHEREIAPGQILRTVVIPHSSGLDVFDTKCFLFTNQEFKQASFTCPEAKQADIEVSQPP